MFVMAVSHCGDLRRYASRWIRDQQNGLFAVTGIILSISFLCEPACGLTAEDVLLAQYENLRVLTSIDVKTVLEKTRYAPKNITEEEIAKIPVPYIRDTFRAGKRITHWETHFIAKGEKYYVQSYESDSIRGSEPEVRTSTYAGDKGYGDQWGQAGRLDMGLKPLVPGYYPSPPGFLEVYGYVAYQKPKQGATLTLLQDKSTWLEVGESAIIGDETTLDGYDVVVLHVLSSNESDGSEYTVYCAKDYGYFPVQYENYAADGSLIARFKASGLKTYTAANGAQFSLHASSRQEYWYFDQEEPTLKSVCTCTIDQDSLRLNEPIDDAVFDVAIAHADIAVNRDTGTAYRVRNGSGVVHDPALEGVLGASVNDKGNSSVGDGLGLRETEPQVEKVTQTTMSDGTYVILVGIGLMAVAATVVALRWKRTPKTRPS